MTEFKYNKYDLFEREGTCTKYCIIKRTNDIFSPRPHYTLQVCNYENEMVITECDLEEYFTKIGNKPYEVIVEL